MELPLLIADPAVAIVALCALILAWGMQALFRPVLARVWQWVPVIGQSALQWADGILAGVAAAVSSWVASSVYPLAAVIAGPWQKLDHLYSQLEAAFAALTGAMQGLSSQIIAQVHAQLVAPLAGQVQHLQAWAQTHVSTLQANIDWVHLHVDQDIHNWIGQAVAALDAKINGAQQTAAQAAGVASAAVSDLQQLRGQVGGLSPASVEGMIGSAVAGIDTQLQDLIGQVGGLTVPLTAELAALRSEEAATQAALDSYLNECGNPMCEAFGGTAKAVNELTKILPAAGLFAMIAAAITDPEGTATAVQDAFGGTIQLFSNLIHAVQGGS